METFNAENFHKFRGLRAIRKNLLHKILGVPCHAMPTYMIGLAFGVSFPRKMLISYWSVKVFSLLLYTMYTLYKYSMPRASIISAGKIWQCLLGHMHIHAHSLEMLHGHEQIKLICLKNVSQRWLGVTANHKENTVSRKYRKCWLQKATWKSLENPNTIYGEFTCTCVYTECINSISIKVWLHTLVQPCFQLVSVAHYWKPRNRASELYYMCMYWKWSTANTSSPRKD